MDEPKKLSGHDFPDIIWVPNGYDETQVPKATDRNFQILVQAHNKLVEYVLETKIND